jgi:large subunit ribosomal protein L31
LCPVVITKEDFLKQHPNMRLIDVQCSSCGASFSVRSTAEAVSVDICANCHPAYTGRERTLASAGRIERFERRRALAAV